MISTRRFGTLDPFFELHDWGFRMGRPVANAAFGRALLEFGSWDEYNFFLPNAAAVQAFKLHLETIFPKKNALDRVVVSSYLDLYGSLSSTEFDIFHHGDFTSLMPHLAGLRQCPGIKPFPISGLTHSLDGTLMQTRFFQCIIGGLSSSDAIICTSRAAQELVINKLHEVVSLLNEATNGNLKVPAVKTPIIPIGIDDQLFSDTLEPDERRKARNFFNIPHDSIVALSVGRLSRDTKTDWLPVLELLNRMKSNDQLNNFLLVIAGGGDAVEVKELQSQIDTLGLKETVFIFANFPMDVKKNLYQMADFYLSLVDNYQETFGVNIIEAMAAGLPVIASDFDGYRDTVEDGKSGFLISTISSVELPKFLDFGMHIFDTNLTRHYLSQMIAIDLEQLQVTIMLICNNANLRKEMGDYARRKAERYRWKNIISDFEELWDDLAQASRYQEKMPDTPTSTASSELLSGYGILSYVHYNSAILGEKTRLQITEVGYGLLKSDSNITRYNTLDSVLSEDLQRSILLHLSILPLQVSELCSRTISKHKAIKGDIHFHLLWLMKHGAIKISKNPS